MGVFTTVAVLSMLVLFQRGLYASAAAFLAFAASFKFFPLIFFVPFAFRREARFLIFAAIACGLFLIVIPGVLLGFGDMLSFYGGLLESYRDSEWVVSNPGSQFFPHVLLRLVGAAGFDVITYPLLCWISYSVAVANLGFISLIQRARLHQAYLWSFQLLFLSIPFLLKTSWPVDLVFISYCQAVLVWQLLEGEEPDLAREALGVGKDGSKWRKYANPVRTAVTFFLLIFSIAFSSVVFFNLVGSSLRYGFYGFIFWADLLCLIATYIVLLPPVTRQLRRTN